MLRYEADEGSLGFPPAPQNVCQKNKKLRYCNAELFFSEKNYPALAAARPYREPRRWPARVQPFRLRLRPGFFSGEPTGELWEKTCEVPFRSRRRTRTGSVHSCAALARALTRTTSRTSPLFRNNRGRDPSSPQQAERGAPCPRRLVRTPVAVHLLPRGEGKPILTRARSKTSLSLSQGERVSGNRRSHQPGPDG